MNAGAAADPVPHHPRRRIARKYIAAFVAVVGGTLLVSGAIDLYVSYRDTRQAVGELQGEKAAGAAAQIERFVAGIHRQLRGALGGEGGSPPPQAALAELRRILFQVPSVEHLAFLDTGGKELARASRLAADSAGSRVDRSATLAFRETRTKDSYIGPVRSEHGAVPFVTMAASGGPGVVVAEVNLAVLSDVVTEIDAGTEGSAYVVDHDGRLLAHPDRTLALSGRDLSALEHIRSALAASRAGRDAVSATGIEGSRVISSFRTAPTPGWLVFVEQPTGSALAPVRQRLAVIAALLAVGTALAVATSVGLARRMVRPIRDLQKGAERLGAGDLAQRISVNSGDELESLADEFNRMGARLARSLDELRASRQRLVAAQDQERRRIERNLHDGAQQELVALAVKVRLARTLLDTNPSQADTLLEEVQGDVGGALENLRDLAHGIYPPMLADNGLASALRSQAQKASLPVEVEADGIRRYAMEVESAVYFCVLEALQNVAKYAGASRAMLRLNENGGRLEFSVSDDGMGFDPATAKRGAGTTNMTDRLEALGGNLNITSQPGAGTTVSGSIPISKASPSG